MAKAGISSKWRQLEAAAASRADCLLLKYGCFSAPLPLTPIARHQRIRRFVFGALPIDGGLAVEGDGFVVYVRSKDEDAAMLLTKLEDESDSGRSLPARARFTIAHEIAHTFFFDTRGAQPKSALKAQHRKEVASLERTCNRIAARLLIPDHVLTPIIDNFPLLDSSGLKALSRSFRVSLKVLIQRLRSSPSWTKKGGAALYVEEEKDDLRVTALLADAPIRMLFPQLEFGSKLTELFSMRPHNLLLFGGSEHQIQVDVPFRMERGVQPCLITCERVSIDRRAFVMTIHRIGLPRLNLPSAIPRETPLAH